MHEDHMCLRGELHKLLVHECEVSMAQDWMGSVSNFPRWTVAYHKTSRRLGLKVMLTTGLKRYGLQASSQVVEARS